MKNKIKKADKFNLFVDAQDKLGKKDLIPIKGRDTNTCTNNCKCNSGTACGINI